MYRRGPGRPFAKPGPIITPKGSIEIPDELVIDFLEKNLNPLEFAELRSLPPKIFEEYIDTFKKALFTVESRQNPSGLVNFGEEELQDLAGVQATISFNPA